MDEVQDVVVQLSLAGHGSRDGLSGRLPEQMGDVTIVNGLRGLAERVPGVRYNDTAVTTWPRFDIATGKGDAELVTDATESETRPSEGVMDVLA